MSLKASHLKKLEWTLVCCGMAYTQYILNPSVYLYDYAPSLKTIVRHSQVWQNNELWFISVLFSFCVPFLIFHCWQEHFFRKVQSSHCPVYNKWWPIDPNLSVFCSTKHILTIHIFSLYLHHTFIMFIMHMFKRLDFNCPQSYNLYVDLIPLIQQFIVYCQYLT